MKVSLRWIKWGKISLLFLDFWCVKNFVLSYIFQLIDGLVGFDKPQVSIEEEANEMSPEMVKVLERIQKQEEK